MGQGLRPGWYGRWRKWKAAMDEYVEAKRALNEAHALSGLRWAIYGDFRDLQKAVTKTRKRYVDLVWGMSDAELWTFDSAYPAPPVGHRGQVYRSGCWWCHECRDCGVTWTAGRGEQGRIVALDYAARHVNFHAS